MCAIYDFHIISKEFNAIDPNMTVLVVTTLFNMKSYQVVIIQIHSIM